MYCPTFYFLLSCYHNIPFMPRFVNGQTKAWKVSYTDSNDVLEGCE
jgi:hypothetical protein